MHGTTIEINVTYLFKKEVFVTHSDVWRGITVILLMYMIIMIIFKIGLLLLVLSRVH